MNVSIEASTITLKGGKSLTIDGGASVDIQAALIKLNQEEPDPDPGLGGSCPKFSSGGPSALSLRANVKYWTSATRLPGGPLVSSNQRSNLARDSMG